MTTQVYRVYIRATAQAVWDAITRPEWTERYGFGGRVEYDLRPGGSFQGFTSDAMRRDGVKRGLKISDVAIDGKVIEADPPKKLVLSWRMVMDAETTAEGFTRLTYEITEGQAGVTRLTLVHELGDARKVASILSGEWEARGAGGGWSWILSDLKTLLETGASFSGTRLTTAARPGDHDRA